MSLFVQKQFSQNRSCDQKLMFTLRAKSESPTIKHEKIIATHRKYNSRKANTIQTKTGKLHHSRVGNQKQGKP